METHKPDTEAKDERYNGFEDWPVGQIVGALLGGQSHAVDAVLAGADQIEEAITAAAERLRSGAGRLVYAGAGTSGRLAVQDGVELTPTFGWPKERCVYLMAGGLDSLHMSIEGAEDDIHAAERDVTHAKIGKDDVVLGLAASGRTPYTRAVLQHARKAGALTIGIANSAGAPLLSDAQIGILLASGAEVLAGSTRLGAGTAQKACLGVFSTALMAKLNKVHRGYMVDVVPSNEKLVGRAVEMIMGLTGCKHAAAEEALANSGGNVKRAVLQVHGVAPDEAGALLEQHFGHLGNVIASLAKER